MIAKSLKLSGSLLMIETRSGRSTPDGRMAKHHRRSVHREVFRPQGARSPQRQFSPVKRFGDVDDDGVNVHGSQHRGHRNGEMQAGPPGFEVVAWIQRSGLELGRPARPPQVRTGASTKGRCIRWVLSGRSQTRPYYSETVGPITWGRDGLSSQMSKAPTQREGMSR